MPVLVTHDEIVAECDVEQAGEVKIWLEKAMIEEMDKVSIGTGRYACLSR